MEDWWNWKVADSEETGNETNKWCHPPALIDQLDEG